MYQTTTSPNPSFARRGIERLLAVIVFLIPWQARWIWQPRQLNGVFWEYGTFSLYAVELVIWVCLLGVAWQIIVRGSAGWPKFNLRRFLSPAGVVFVGSFGLVVLSWLSLLWAADAALALQGAFRLTEAVALMVVLLNASSRGRLGVMVAWALSAALQGILAVVQFFSQTVVGSTVLGVDPQLPGELGASVIELTSGRWLRAYGTFPHPNMLAGFLVLGILCAGAWYVHHYRTFQRVCALGCALLAGVGLVFTFSRSGAAALVAGFAVWGFMAVWRRNVLPSLRFIGLTSLVAVAAAVWVVPQVGTRLAGAGRLEVKSSVERRILLHEGLKLAQRSLPLGVGIGQTTVVSYRQDPSRPGFAYQPPHNVALLALVELGVDGLLLLMLFGLGAVMRATRFPAGAGMFVAAAVLGWFDHYLWTLLPGMLMAWILAGVLLGRSRND